MAGRESSYFLLGNGLIKACGRNDEGQLGDGTFVDNALVTVNIPDGQVMTSIASGPSSQSAFFLGQSSVFGAGANDQFQLGIGVKGSRKFPVAIDFDVLLSVAGIEKISSSGTHTVALNCPGETFSIPLASYWTTNLHTCPDPVATNTMQLLPSSRQEDPFSAQLKTQPQWHLNQPYSLRGRQFIL